MKKSYRLILNLFITCFLLFLFPLITRAASATTSFNGSSTVYVGNNVEVILSINTDTPIVAIQGTISYDKSKLELVSQTSLAPFEISANGTKIAGMDMTGNVSITGNKKLIKLTFKTKEVGTTIISFNGSKQVGTNSTSIATTGCSKTIKITNPPSSNNNLSSLKLSDGSINFNKNTTSYNVYVGSNVTSVNISATAEDSDAKVTGTGNKSLSYGNNTINVVVTAASGDKKTYTIVINRKDNRSENNYLSSLTIKDGSINFDKNTLEYTLTVPYSVTDLNITTKPEDSKSKVSITGKNNLISEETKDVKIHVTAENGSVRTYTLHVTRGKDPNKVLSTNNYLASLNVSVGLLSPEFNKEKEVYVVYLPFEVDTINIEAEVEDTKYGILKKEGPDKLGVGNNEYKLSVTAEDESVRTYKIIVIRGASVDETTTSTSTYLKELSLENSELIKSFDKNIYSYEYKRISEKLVINALPEDENSSVSILNVEDIYIITVDSSLEKKIYILRPEETSSILPFIISILTFVIGLIIGNYQKKKNK